MFRYLLSVLLFFSVEAHAQSLGYEVFSGMFGVNSEEIFVFPDEISESSGLVKSRKNPNFFWTHNDSGNETIIYGIHSDFGILARIKLVNLKSKNSRGNDLDLEDISIGPCTPDNEKHCLFIANIGDNMDKRGTLDLDYPKIYIIEEPIINDFITAETLPLEIEVEPKVIKIYYEDYIPYDAEAFAVTENLDFLVITKDDAFVFRLPYAEWSENLDSEEPIMMHSEGQLAIGKTYGNRNGITAATYFNGFLVVRTYIQMHFFYLNPIMPGISEWTELENSSCYISHLGTMGEGLDFVDNVVYASSENDRDGEKSGEVDGLINKVGKKLIEGRSGAIYSTKCTPFFIENKNNL